MSDPFRRFDGLTYREISARLERDGLPLEQIEATLTDIRAHRSQRSNAKRHRREPFAGSRCDVAAIAGAVLACGALANRSAAVDGLDLDNPRPGFLPPRARIHRQRAADRSGDTGKEFRGT